ncbi:MAG: flagellar filament capping protein FliD [Chloroflexi bacterium]|nr:flagellar filament capping protein FliD [Chloroflexota bacterium]
MASVTALDSYFTSLINDLMLLERVPLARLQEQRDNLNVRKAVFTDVEDKLSGLQDLVKSLSSGSYTPALAAGRAAAVSDAPTGMTVLTASVSDSAMVGAYNLHVTTLATAHRVRSTQQTYADQALNLSGSIRLGGDAARAATLVSDIDDTVTGSSTGSIASGQDELGSGSYFVETRQESGVWQFRVVDSNGNAVSVRQGTSGEAYTSAWQDIPTGGGAYDSGRGLTLTFGANSALYLAASRGAGAAEVDYDAQGATIAIAASDSLVSIADKINAATYAQGNGVTATVVDRQLVLSAADTGVGHSIRAVDASGTVLTTLGILGTDGGAGDTGAPDGFKYTLQEAGNASFTLNGITVTRSANRGLTDVISGVTLNLAADAEGQDATLTVSEDWTGALDAIDTLVEQFNDVTAYLEEQTAVTRQTNGDTITYTRGGLADDYIFGELRMDLFNKVMSDYSVGGAYTNLREIGLTIDDNLQFKVSDRAALEGALSSNFDDVAELMDEVVSALDDKLGRFTGITGEDGYIDISQDSVENQITEIDTDIADMNVYLAQRQQYLVDQYSGMQAQLLALSYTQQMWASIYGSMNAYG